MFSMQYSEELLSKVCSKCGETKEVSLFYKRQGACIVCFSEQVKQARERRVSTPEGRERAREIARNSYHSIGYIKAVANRTPEKLLEQTKKHRAKYPEVYQARKICFDLGGKNGIELHHWSYAVENARDVIELPRKEHHLVHRFMHYDQQKMLYIRNDNGQELFSREIHESFIKEILSTHPTYVPNKRPESI